MLALGSLNLQTREPGAETWCPGWYSLRGSTRRYRDWKKEGHGHVDMVNAIAQSCDVYFYVLARDMGIEQIHRTLTGFGFGAPTGIDIGGEASGLVPSTRWKQQALGQPWYPGETLIAGIGQGATLVTPMQLAHGYDSHRQPRQAGSPFPAVGSTGFDNGTTRDQGAGPGQTKRSSPPTLRTGT